MNKPEIECIRCEWSGSWVDCAIEESEQSEYSSQCPGCGAYDSVVETDGVSEKNYREDNPGEVPNE